MSRKFRSVYWKKPKRFSEKRYKETLKRLGLKRPKEDKLKGVKEE